MSKNFKKIQGFILVGLFCVLLMALSAGFYWQMALKNNLSSTEKISLKIYPQDDFESVYAQLENHLLRPNHIVRVARWMKYDQHIKSGYYVIKPQQGNKAIVRQLAQGLQKPVKLRFNNIRTLPQLAGVLSKQIMLDSTQIMDAMCDTAFLRAQGWTYET
ncbi:MAG: endolytic transglycosylase MltG, partial [Bacteroidales bacterium]|nr:endolytic transglycosylase MltG [Bacteroidales bacterium]